jgi:DNA-binding IclR family transcriptional regulator
MTSLTSGEPPTSASASATQGIQSVSRALAILELFSDRRPTLTAVEIGQLTGLNRATAYRFCQALLGLGYLEDAGQRHFRPGLKTVSLAQAALGARGLSELAAPVLHRLQAQTGEAVNMAQLDGTEVVYVARLLADHLITLRLTVGSRLPAYATSLGRAILAFLPEEETESILDRTRLEPLTEHTITDRRKLRGELKRIRERGFAINEQGLSLGLRGVAAPVFGAAGRPIAAINVSIPHPVADQVLETEFAPQVMRAAEEIRRLVVQSGVDAAH